MRLLLVLAALVACQRDRGPDPEIAEGFHQLWDARVPALRRTACPDGEAKRARIAPLVQLAADSAETWNKWDEPLPAALAERLAALDPGATTADDLRCLVLDPATKSDAWMLLGRISALLEHKGELAIVAGNLDGWRWIAESLRVFRDPHPQVYIWFFQPTWILERGAVLAREHAPPADARAALVAAADAGVMSRAAFCAGLAEEVLAHGSFLFYGHVTDLHDAFVDRWGPELAPVYDEDHARNNRPDREHWFAYRDLAHLVATACTTTDVRRAAAPLLATLRNAGGQVLDVAISRVGDYDRLAAAAAAFRAQLGPRGT